MPVAPAKQYSVVGNIRLHAANNSMSTHQPKQHSKDITLNIQSAKQHNNTVQCTQCNMLTLMNGQHQNNSTTSHTRRCDACHTVRSQQHNSKQSYKPNHKHHSTPAVDEYDSIDRYNDNQAVNTSSSESQHSVANDTLDIAVHYINQLELLYAQSKEYTEFNKLTQKFHKQHSTEQNSTTEQMLLLVRALHCAWQITHNKLNTTTEQSKVIHTQLHNITEQLQQYQHTVQQLQTDNQQLQQRVNTLQHTVQSNITHYENKLKRRDIKIHELQHVISDLTRIQPTVPTQYNDNSNVVHQHVHSNNRIVTNPIARPSTEYAESTIAESEHMTQYMLSPTLQPIAPVQQHNTDVLHSEIERLQRELNAVKLQNQATELRHQLRQERKLRKQTKQTQKPEKPATTATVQPVATVQPSPVIAPVQAMSNRPSVLQEPVIPTPQSPQQQLSYSSHVVEAAIQRSKLLREQYNKLQHEQQQHLLQLATQQLHDNIQTTTHTVPTPPIVPARPIDEYNEQKQAESVEIETEYSEVSSMSDTEDDSVSHVYDSTAAESHVQELGKYTLYKLSSDNGKSHKTKSKHSTQQKHSRSKTTY